MDLVGLLFLTWLPRSAAVPVIADLSPSIFNTTGGDTMVITGTDFSSDLAGNVVDVGGMDCPVFAATVTQLKCSFPAGSGKDKLVTVSSASETSTESVYAHYAPPEVTAIEGCVDVETSTAQCPTAGGIIVTVQGFNFGAVAADITVTVASLTCTALSIANPGTIICTLPPGNGQALAVEVVVSQQSARSVPHVNVSYTCNGGFEFSGAECTPCPKGSSSAVGAACAVCPSGRYSSETGQAFCLQCPQGRTSGENSTMCDACAEGRFAPDPGTPECSPCQLGKYADAKGQQECVSCPFGKFANETGMRRCLLCDLGHYANESQSSLCRQCEPGSSSNVRGTATCPPCEPGSYSADFAQHTCDACATGHYASQPRATACAPCNLNTFAPDEGSSECSPCPTATGPGASSCPTSAPTAAVVPTAAPTLGPTATAIMPTAAPTLVPTATAIIPTAAPTLATAVPTATSCPAGTWSTANSECAPCPEGHFSAEGDTACTPCEPGYFQDAVGSVGCMPCEAGFYQNASTAVACTPCPVDTTSSLNGAVACVTCALGTAAAEASSACVEVVTDTCQTALEDALGYLEGMRGSQSLVGMCGGDLTAHPGAQGLQRAWLASANKKVLALTAADCSGANCDAATKVVFAACKDIDLEVELGPEYAELVASAKEVCGSQVIANHARRAASALPLLLSLTAVVLF